MANPRSSRTDLVASAIRTLASRPGASLEEIAQEAGVGRATLHRHFGSRNGLIRELAQASIEETNSAVAAIDRSLGPSERLLAVLEAVVPLGDRFHFLAQEWEVLKDPEIAAGIQQQLERLSELVGAMKKEGLLAPEIPDAWVVAALDALVYAAWNSLHGGWIARREAPSLVFRTIMNGLGPR